MQYPIAIEWGDDQYATGISIPDIPNAVTAGDTFEEAYKSAVEAAYIMLEEMANNGEKIPMPSTVSELQKNTEYSGWGWGMIEIDIAPYLGKSEKINVTLPGTIIRQIDDFVSHHSVKSRSAFLADAALQKLGSC